MDRDRSTAVQNSLCLGYSRSADRIAGFWATAVETRRWAIVLASAIGVFSPVFIAQLEILVNPTANKIAEICFFDSIVIRRLDVKAEVGSEKSINQSGYNCSGI